MVSLPLGAVRLQQEFLRSDPPEKQDIARLKQFIDRELRRAERKLGMPRVSAGDCDLRHGGGAGRGERRDRRRSCRCARRWQAASKQAAASTTDSEDVRRAGGQAGEDEQRAARVDAGHRAEAVGDHHWRRAWCMRT